MKSTTCLISALALAATLPAPLQAKTIELAPSSAWNLHYDEDSCVLRRAFGDEKQFFQIEMRKFSPSARFQVAAFGKGLSNLQRISSYRFSAEEKWRDAAPTAGKFGEDMRGVFFDLTVIENEQDPSEERTLAEMRQFAAQNIEAAGKVSALHLRVGGNEIVLDSGPLQKPLQAVDGCIDELMTHWGLDPKVQNTRLRAPIPVNLKAVSRMMDYPPKMVQDGLPGIVNVRLAVSETGKVSDCRIQVPLSDPAFEEYACGDIQTSMDFEPALDAQGRPVASYWTTTVRYRLF